ncbi:FecR domain-containing protein [Burkholderia sp. Ax-1724]|uniref:FecR family protein n=1 Tax=Burkholderia sp. Ax-1724 TaxID=2608336 RepID=UPI001423C762|nr:FecR domain-containing protein [Burkholderia sp. Ax-1724]NIF56648.1 DUF4974 domain-containing protein [Burkholderia sp. Ax-1724]
MPLTQAEIDVADDLLVSLAFGSDEEKSRARTELDEWASSAPARLQYVADHHAAERTIDALADDLGRLYRRHVDVPARARLTPAAPTIPTAPTLSPPRGKVAPRAPRQNWYRGAAAYGAGLLFCSVSALWIVNPVLSSEHLQSAIGEHLDATLADGSQVVLNTDTELTFVNRLRSRDVTMQRGEALFSVVHNAVRPFEVAAGTASVRDIGTRFSVRKMSDGVDVAVLEGNVELSAASGIAPVALSAGQAARADRLGSVEIQDQQQFEAMTSWKDNRLQFNGTPLRDVVEEVQRYRKTPVVLADSRIGDYRVTGGFSSTDPDLLLKTLSQVVPVTVEFQKNGTAVIASRR